MPPELIQMFMCESLTHTYTQRLRRLIATETAAARGYRVVSAANNRNITVATLSPLFGPRCLAAAGSGLATVCNSEYAHCEGGLDRPGSDLRAQQNVGQQHVAAHLHP